MEVIYTGEENKNNKKTCFLAGPTPRDKNVLSWRKEAISLFESLGYDEALYVPEIREKPYYDMEDNTSEMDWDQNALENADIVMFWIPRNTTDMLGLSTNVEFGYLLNKGNIIYGRPESAVRCEFLDYLYKEKLGKDYKNTLEDLVKEGIKTIKDVK